MSDPLPSDPPVSAGHVAVLPAPILQLLDAKPGQVMLDCTVGRGGHAAMILPRLSPGGRYIGLDVDPNNLEFTRQRLSAIQAADATLHVDLVHSNFVDARSVLKRLGVERVDLLLADFGFSSNQMTDPARGFSVMTDGPLDMRLDPTSGSTAADLVNRLPERELADLIYHYGEERLSRRIASKIVEQRRISPITTTSALADIVRQAFGLAPAFEREKDGGDGQPRRRPRIAGIDPATRTFMALRIAVNGELDAIERLLTTLPRLVRPGGVAALISFHSLEDRLVKHAFAELEKAGRAQRITRKPVVADDQEIAANPRSRSAKLRAIRIGSGER